MRHNENNTCTRIGDWFKEYKIEIIISSVIVIIFGLCAICTSKLKVFVCAAAGFAVLLLIVFLLTFMMNTACKQSYLQSVLKGEADICSIGKALIVIVFISVALGGFVWFVDAARGSTTGASPLQEALSQAEKSYDGLQSLQCENPQTVIHPENTNDIREGIMNCIAGQEKDMHNYRIEWTMTDDQDFTITDIYRQDGTSWMKI
ncbi:MAG: hypothetical protein II207_02720 [Clostridia bacterium]|nr:hypothetical protein [Clostridia bacterium]